MTELKIVPPILATEERRLSIIKILKECLEKAEAGELETLVVIVGYAGGYWDSRFSDPCIVMSEVIGRLEITKQEWIASYLAAIK